MECKAPDFTNADFCIIVPDDSMINARLFAGDIVYIRQQNITSRKTYASPVVQLLEFLRSSDIEAHRLFYRSLRLPHGFK